MSDAKPKVKYVCDECGSDDVMLDAYPDWDVDSQQWELRSTFDQAYCESCGGETSISEVELDEEPEDDDAEPRPEPT